MKLIEAHGPFIFRKYEAKVKWVPQITAKDCIRITIHSTLVWLKRHNKGCCEPVVYVNAAGIVNPSKWMQ